MALVVIVWLAVPGLARANTMNVTFSGAEPLADGTCTLREALMGGFTECAGTGEPGPVIVQLPAGAYTWAGAAAIPGTAMPRIVTSMIIRGAGSGATILSANPAADLRLFDVAAKDVIIEGITFDGWTGDGPWGQSAGVIWQAPNSGLTVRDCVFRNNRTSLGNGVGAAINSNGSRSEPTYLTIERTTFEGNAAFYAGALWTAGVNVTIVDSTFSGNTATQIGGAVRIVAGEAQVVSIKGTKFLGNFVTHPTHGTAGAMTLDGTGTAEGTGTFTVESSTFARNHAPGPGALELSAIVTIDGCNFEDNAATASSGGAIDSGVQLIVRNSVFTGNTTDHSGGALVCISGGSCLVERSRFEGNRASGGGAIASSAGILTVTDSIFFDNVSDLRTLSVVATDNSATEGGDTGRFTVERRENSSAIRTDSPHKITISGNCFLGQTGYILSGANVDARSNFWTASDATVRGDAGVDSSNALTLAPPGCDPSRQATQGATTVAATYAGEATSGTDYLTLPATITFAPGVSAVNVDVTAIFDELAENSEHVSLTAMGASAWLSILDGVPSDLRIVSTVDRETVKVGDELVFTLTVTNAGPGPAKNFVITDVLPAGPFGLFVDAVLVDAVFPIGATAQCVPGPPATCTIPSLAATQVLRVTLRARAVAAGVVHNRAEVAAASDTTLTNNASEVVVTVAAADTGAGGAGAGGAGAGGAGIAGAGGVATSSVAAGGVATSSVAAGGVATSSVAAGGVATSSVAAGGVATSSVAAGGVATSSVAAGGVATSSVAAGGVATRSVAAGGVAAGGVATSSSRTGRVAAGGVATRSTRTGGAGSGGTAAADGGEPDGDDNSGCGCRVAGNAHRARSLLWTCPLAIVIAAGALRRRRKHLRPEKT